MASLRPVLRRFPATFGCGVLRSLTHCSPARLLPHTRPGTVLLQCPRVSFHNSGRRANQHIINIQDEEDFKKRVTGSNVPVVVDFHATWCGPCKLLGPRLETIVAAQNGDVIMAKVDIDELSDIAMNHGVSAVPTVVGIKDGKVADMFVGVKDDPELESFVNKLTGK